MGESKDILIRQEIENENLPEHEPGCECPSCMTEWKRTQYDPDHLNPSKGGNRAGDDYW